ncbi:MAG: ribosome biogenesis GTP-binding protein YihA/YsxC [Negativicutes bacterium]|nr:ribosome biogenesis GTP-binding protein YihA/YsxC [Negativicutes bacterium]
MTGEVPLDVIKAQYTASAVRANQYPEGDLTEVAFVGRSNVGKSSLINSLCRHGGLARVSGTPGKTQTLNFYTVTLKLDETERQEFFLVDLPGYGYARAGRENRQQWSKFIDEYLAKSPRLKLVCQLIDSRHPPMDSDKQVYLRLAELGAPVQVVATKTDKLSRMAINKQLAVIKAGLGMPSGQTVIAYSVPKSVGRTELLDVIQPILLK